MVDHIDQQSNTAYFYGNQAGYVQNFDNIVVIRPKHIFLPIKPLNMRKITIFNHTGDIITIDSNFKNDLIYNSSYSPNGSKMITLENNRMVILTFVCDFTTAPRNGTWYMNHT
jgi:hypothetical protein